MKRTGLTISLICISLFLLGPASYAQSGSLDAGFGTGGMSVASPPLADDPSLNGALDMVFQNDGKIVLLARANDTAATFRTVLVRFTVDGQLDATFGSGGFVYIPAEAYAGTFARRLVKQTISGQERFVIASGDSCGSANCIKVQRYTTAGTIDTSFGSGGVATVPGGGLFVLAAAVQADQKILLGSMETPLIRLNADGSGDTSFGPNGISTFRDTKMLFNSIVPLADGKILTSGAYMNTENPDFFVARFTSNGRSDGSFGTQGKWLKDFAGKDDSANALAVDSSGKIVAVGRANMTAAMNDRTGWDAVIVRLTSKGAVDKTFGSNGIAAPLNNGGGEDQFRTISIQSNGKLVVTGRGSLAGNTGDVLTARYNTNGTLDTSFDADGWKLTDIYGGNDLAMAGLIQLDPTCSCNKLVVAATAPSGPSPSPQYIVGLRFTL